MSTPTPHPGSVLGETRGWFAQRGLVRPAHGRWFGGVCVGLARAAGMPPLAMRALWVLSFVLPGPQFLAYLALWALMPHEDAAGSPPAWTAAAGRRDLRASDAEREEIADALRRHAAAGRLSPDELDERLEQAYRARLRRDLDGLLHDLPHEPAPATPRPHGGSAALPVAILAILGVTAVPALIAATGWALHGIALLGVSALLVLGVAWIAMRLGR
jgi:phage shock protein PspC (stress-responsive transcriptional regulator)